jgi:hypothetical protein
MSLDIQWRTAFFEVVQQPEYAARLKEASLKNAYARWTQTLTDGVVTVCRSLGWSAAAKGHRLQFLPESRSEYLGIDVIGFEKGDRRWSFPCIAIELENSQRDDRIAYSLWKVLCLRARLRIVFCYRPISEAGPDLVHFLDDTIIGSMKIEDRVSLQGDTIVVMGYRNKAETFPYGFFKWWKLDRNIGKFDTLH